MPEGSCDPSLPPSRHTSHNSSPPHAQSNLTSNSLPWTECSWDFLENPGKQGVVNPPPTHQQQVGYWYPNEGNSEELHIKFYSCVGKGSLPPKPKSAKNFEFRLVLHFSAILQTSQLKVAEQTKVSHIQKKPSPQVTGNFSTCPCQDSKTGIEKGPLAVSGNAL